MAEDDLDEGPSVADSWSTGRLAVNAFTKFCLDQGWVFTETPEQNDFGKDGYLDFAYQGHLTGQCIAVQIKGGHSYKSGDGFCIPADRRHRTLWMNSSVPVFGVVWDPDGGLYWVDITSTLRSSGIATTLEVPAANRIDGGGLDSFLEAMWRATVEPWIAVALGSDDAELQEMAAFDCLGLGRKDSRYLVLLRRVMFGLQPPALDRAIHVLNECSINPDLPKDTQWMSMENRWAVREHFVWSVDEAVKLLDRVQDQDYFERGSYSLCIYWLLIGTKPSGSHFIELVESAALTAVAADELHSAKWAMFLLVFWADEDGQVVFDRLLGQAPVLGESVLATEIAQHLAEFGRLWLS